MTTLTRIEPKQNMARFYYIEILPDLFGGVQLVRKCGRVGWQHCAKVADRKLDMLNRVATITELMQPPSNRLERLKGKRSGEHSIRINDQWRVCFVWRYNGPENVKIEYYH